MAAYASSVTIRTFQQERVGRLLCIFGTVDVTNYNSTLVEVNGITKFFKGDPTVVLGGLSDNGFGGAWVNASKSIKCFTFPDTAGAATELADDTDAGAFEFIAIGAV